MAGFIIKTYKGVEFTVAELDIAGFETDLNNRSLRTIALANMVLNKRNIKTVIPQEQPEPGEGVYQLTTMDGEKYNVAIENFDPVEINKRLNDLKNDFVLIGNVLVQSNNFDFLM